MSGDYSFSDVLWGALRDEWNWPGWFLAALASVLAWRDRNSRAALCCLIVAWEAMFLSVVTDFCGYCITLCFSMSTCGPGPWPLPYILPVCFAPQLLMSLFVLLRKRWGPLEPHERRAVWGFGISAANFALALFGLLFLLITPFETIRRLAAMLGLGR